MKKRILSILLCLCMAITLLPVTALAADPVPVTELWVGSTQVVQSGGTVTADISGEGWSYDNATATLTLNGANITTTAIKNPYGENYYYGIYCSGDLNIIVAGDSTIDARAAAGNSSGICVVGSLSVSGSAELTAEGNWRGLFVDGSLILSDAVTLNGIAESPPLGTINGVYVSESITVSDTANLTGIAKGGQTRTNGIMCMKGRITIDSGATMTGKLEDGTNYSSDMNAGVATGNRAFTSYDSGEVRVEGTLVAEAGNATEHGHVAGLYLFKTNVIISGNGSINAKSGDSGFESSTSYGVEVGSDATITINAGGFLASGGTCAVNPATTSIVLDGTPVYYEVSANRDGSSATVCTDTETWNSTYNGQFGAYKYINATTLYEVYINGTQVTRVNRHDVLGDGTVSYLPSADGSPAQLTLDGASLTTLQLDGDTEFALTGANTVGTVTEAGAVTLSGGGGLTLTGSLDCGSESLTVESGAAVTVQGTVTAGAVVNGGTLINEGSLILPEATTVEQIQAINLTGDGIVKAGSRIYLDGILYADGGDASPGGIDLSTLPAEGTYYKAGSGYALFTPATPDPAANAKLALHHASIVTTSATALTLPSDAPVDIVVAGGSSITAGGSGNVIYTNGQALSVTGSGDLTLAGNNYGISVNGTGAVSINIDGDLTFNTVYQPISTSADITVSAKSITSNSGYYFQSGSGSVSLTATDGDIVFDETGKTNKNYKISAGQNITLNAPNGKIDISHSNNCSALMSIIGTVTVSALNDVIINAASGGGISTSSGAVSVTSQSGSIMMNCGDYYECVTADNTGDAITLSAAEDITLNGSAADTNAIAASSRAVDITAGGTLSSTSAFGFQVRELTIKANEVSIEGTTQDGIQATSVIITNPTGGNCESVSITAMSSSDSWAAIHALGTGNITVKTDDLFICGKTSAKAINATGTVTIGDAGMIVGAISAGTDNIDSHILRAAYGGDISTSGLDLSASVPVVATYYTASSGYALFTPATTTPATLTLHNASINTTTGSALALPDNTVVVLEGSNSTSSEDAAAIYGGDALAVQGSGTLNASGVDDGGLFAEQITVTGSADVTVNGIDNGDENEPSVTVSGNAVFTSTESIHTGSYVQSGSASVTVNGQSLHGITTIGELRVDGGSLTVTSEVAALISVGGITLGSGMTILTPSGGKIASTEITVESVTRTITSVIPAGEAALTAELAGSTISSNGATNVVIGTAPVTPGSGGGGGSSSTTVTVPVTGGSGSTSISASVSGGTATVSVSDAQLKEIASGSETGTLKIDLSGLKADAAVIPAKLVSAANTASGSTGLAVALPGGTVTFDKAALASVIGKGDVKISVETVNNSALSDAQKAVLGNQANTALVVDVNVFVNGTLTSTFGDGRITVSIPYTPKSGENTDSITVWFIKDDGTIEPKNGVYNAATGCVEFTTEHLSQYLIVSFPFADVTEDAWYYGSVAYAYNNGLFAGTGAATFSPETSMTRQMIWMVLARMDGKTPADMDAARAWAIENGISDGTNPTNSITREQMATILYRYAQYKSYDTTQGGMETREFADYDSISEYALPALGWSVNAGLMQGSDNNLMPSGSATRAQVATILQRFCQNVAK
ncbi:S-layer homology domain-containing protein [Oscillibacter sp.]|uniref:beta strand repeat-containing protein n=1 Tax=Oscillibacter sp. TaxID=1945593 RepID=UPI0028A2AE18|nr:S-layer homology domain-containing protein [Oscillibacter sp.]